MAMQQQVRVGMRERWHARRRQRLAMILARFVVVLALVGVLAWWLGGAPWMLGWLIVAAVMVALRLALFAYNGRRFRRRFASR